MDNDNLTDDFDGKIKNVRKRFVAAYGELHELMQMFLDDAESCIPISTDEMGRLQYMVGVMAMLHGKTVDNQIRETIKMAHAHPEWVGGWYDEIVKSESKRKAACHG